MVYINKFSIFNFVVHVYRIVYSWIYDYLMKLFIYFYFCLIIYRLFVLHTFTDFSRIISRLVIFVYKQFNKVYNKIK